MSLPKKSSLISVLDFSKEEIEKLLESATLLKRKKSSYSDLLKDKVVGIYTNKPSLRTRISFEIGISELGAKSLFFKEDELKISSREPVEDSARVLSKYLDLIIIRTHSHQELVSFEKFAKIPVINGLTEQEHPCQAFSDLFTLKELFSELKGLRLTYIGDGNNVANSLMFASCLLGLSFKAISPRGHEIKNELLEKAKKLAKFYNHPQPEVSNNPKELLQADIAYTDVWQSMNAKNEKFSRELFLPYQVRKEILASEKTLVLHCLPRNPGQEISSEIFQQNKELIYQQAENRIYAQKAILLKALKSENIK